MWFLIELLNYYYNSVVITGIVIQGLQEGRALGYPTANLEYTSSGFQLQAGVYAGTVVLEGRTHTGAIVIGGNFKTDQPLKFEVHLLDFEGNLYGKELVVTVLDKIRDLIQFEDTDALIAQIENDITQVRSIV